MKLQLLLIITLIALSQCSNQLRFKNHKKSQTKALSATYDQVLAFKLFKLSAISYCVKGANDEANILKLVQDEFKDQKDKKPFASLDQKQISVFIGQKNDLGYVLYEKEEDNIYVVFRGDQYSDKQNLYSSINSVSDEKKYKSENIVEITNQNKYFSNKAFEESVEGLKENLIKSIQQIKQASQSKTPNLVFTGHSVGGSLAILAAKSLFENNEQIKINALYVFGAPQVGDQDLADYYSAQIFKDVPNFRVRHTDDPVPILFQHLNKDQYSYQFPEIYYKDDKESQNNFEQCTNFHDSKCSDNRDNSQLSTQIFKDQLKSHLLYFGKEIGKDLIAQCLQSTKKSFRKQMKHEQKKIESLIINKQHQRYSQGSTRQLLRGHQLKFI